MHPRLQSGDREVKPGVRELRAEERSDVRLCPAVARHADEHGQLAGSDVGITYTCTLSTPAPTAAARSMAQPDTSIDEDTIELFAGV